MQDRIINTWTVGEYTIDEVPNWHTDQSNLFRFRIGDAAPSHIYYRSLDMALAQAIAAKYMGPAMASGPGVGSAADWFARMIGLDS